MDQTNKAINIYKESIKEKNKQPKRWIELNQIKHKSTEKGSTQDKTIKEKGSIYE